MRLSCRAALVVLALTACNAAPREPAASGAAAPDSLSPMDRRLLASASIALPPSGFAAESLPARDSMGARILVQYCVQCHALPSPAMHAANDWPVVLRRMWMRIDMMHGELGATVPEAAARVQLTNYLTGHALQVASSLPAGPIRPLFEATCSRCHALPDPRTHSSADWPAVVGRMERNMQRMKVSGISREQYQQLVGYLGAASRR